MRYLRYFLPLGIILITLGLLSSFEPITIGFVALSEGIKISNFLLIFGISLATISGIGAINAKIDTIKSKTEERYRAKLPVDVIYAEHIDDVFTVPPRYLEKLEKEGLEYKERLGRLTLRGVSNEEVNKIDPSKYTIFIPKEPNDPIELYGDLHDELGHITARCLGIRDKTKEYGVALAYRFKGFLEGAKRGRFSAEKAIEHIEQDLKTLEYNANFLTPFQNHPLEHMDERELFVIRKYNPDLKFRNRELDELLVELDRSIDYVLKKPSIREKILNGIKSILKI